MRISDWSSDVCSSDLRLTRGQVLSVKTEDYVEGARAVGLTDFAIILRYILPNVFAPVLVQATLTIATAIIPEAALSFRSEERRVGKEGVRQCSYGWLP